MSLPPQSLFTCPPRFNCSLCFFRNSASFSHPKLKFQTHNLQTPPNLTHRRSSCKYRIWVLEPSRDYGGFDLESILSVSELLSLFSSAVLLLVLAVNFVRSNSKRAIWVLIGDGGLVWGFPLVVAAAVVNAWIRRLQWRRICWRTASGAALEVNLLDRIEKLEEGLRSSTAAIRALSRRLEKLGIRFMVTRKTLRDPIAETAALAQINSEDTRALDVQEDVLEKELLEMQKVLLAMQEQQQKQLELIVAIGEKGKLVERKQTLDQERTRIERHKSANEDSKELEAYEV